MNLELPDDWLGLSNLGRGAERGKGFLREAESGINRCGVADAGSLCGSMFRMPAFFGRIIWAGVSNAADGVNA